MRTPTSLLNMYDDVPSGLARRYQIALSKIDQVFQSLVIMTKGRLSVYEHNSPIRALEFVDEHGIGKRILVEPADLAQTPDKFSPPMFNIELEAWKGDRGKQKTWHKRYMTVSDFPEDFGSQLQMFEQCLAELGRARVEDLE